MSQEAVLRALGLAETASQAEIAEYVARCASLAGPTSPQSEALLADVVRVLDVALVSRQDLFDTAEAANSALGRLWTKWGRDRWEGVASELGVVNLDSPLRRALAVEIVPALGRAGLVELWPPESGASPATT